MATKINTTYYGAENTWENISGTNGDIKVSPTTFSAHIHSSGADKWNIENNDNLNMSISPWGIGRCSLSSMNYYMLTSVGRNNTDNFGGNLRKKYYDLNIGNLPIMFTNTSGSIDRAYTYSTYTWLPDMKGRAVGKTKPLAGSNSSVTSTNGIDNNAELYIGDRLSSGKPVTYANYQKLRYTINDIALVEPTDNAINTATTTFNDLKNYTSQSPTEAYRVIAANCTIQHSENAGTKIYTMVGSKTFIPEWLLQLYFDSDAQQWIEFERRLETQIGFCLNSPDNAGSKSPYMQEDLESGNKSADLLLPSSLGFLNFCSASKNRQKFDDVSYHWEIRWFVNYPVDGQYKYVEIRDYDKIPALAGHSYTGRIWVELIIDDSIYGSYYESCYYALLHEAAFLGLPFCAESDRTAAIGSNSIFLPVFDDHMITTGNYLSGEESLDLPNAEWIDIFSAEMPSYDPDYQPPTPDTGDDDRGDLSNFYPNRYTNAGGLSQWVVSQEQVVKIAGFLNGTYLPTAADLDADFKGTNPMQYIVSVQKYPFKLPNVGSSSNIYIGKNDTTIQGKRLFEDWNGIGVLPINNRSSYDFGSIEIEPYYGDFRDYQSKILLFMPFIGTDELDPRLYIGHDLSLIYRVDYNTGAVIAEIKRDGLTMEVKEGTLSITVPFLAADMGSYQNQLAQLSYSKDMAKIKGASAAISAGFTMAAGAQGTMSSGQPPLAALSNITQSAMQLATNATQLSQLDYQIEHTAPQVGTISTAAAATAFLMDNRARVVIIRPKMLLGYNAQEYSHTVGNACCRQGALSSFSGYTVAAAADLSGVTTRSGSRAATEEEKNAIRKALQSGIYL